MATSVNSEIEQHPFYSTLVEKCRELRVNLILEPSTAFGGIECNGYFDPTGPTGVELAIAINGPRENWEKVMVHEYNHMMQWHEDCQAWKDCYFDEARAVDCCNLLDWWLEGYIDLDNKKLRRVTMACLGVELDCEKRTVEMIERLRLDIDVEDYIQKANAYVLFYHFVARKREWYKMGREPYSVPECYEVFSKKFDENYLLIGYNQVEAFRKL
jgi:hypothetical protein